MLLVICSIIWYNFFGDFMRVISGKYRGKILDGFDIDGTRPTMDRVKESLFAMIQEKLINSVVLDLFAGSGGIGIEALSRGAKHAYFAENSKEALACIDYNIKHTKFTEESTILKQDAITALSFTIKEKVDIVFCDAPYDKGYDRMVLEAGMNASCVTEDTLFIIEELKDTDFSYALSLGYDIIKENGHVTAKSLSGTLSGTVRTIERDIKYLRENGFIVKEGKHNDGVWKVLK